MPELHHIVIKKSALEALPERELSVLLGGGKLLNEMNIGTKYLWFSMNAVHAAEDSPANSAAALTAASFFLRVLAGQVFEAYEYFRKVIRVDELRKSKSNLLDAAFFADVQTVRKYFGRTNIVSQMRKKFSFHTDVDLLRKSFELVPAEYTYDVLLGKEYQGHSIFYGSEMIIVDGIQHLKPAQDWKTAIDSAFVDTIHIANIVSRVFQRIIGFIMTEHLKITMNDAETVTATDGPPIDTVRVPFFCQPPRATGSTSIKASS
jgi:hypothetical protein